MRAHNWVVMGALLPGTPWTYLPHAARLYCRASQLPQGETFRTKTTLALERLRQADVESNARILGVFDEAYAVETVVEPCVYPAPGQRRIEILTRLRVDARLYHPVVVRAQRKGRRPQYCAHEGPVHLSAATRPGAGPC